MNTKSALLSLAMLVGTVAAPTTALAHDKRPCDDNRNAHPVAYRPVPPPPMPARGVPTQAGRYELRNVSRWVPGEWQQVWVNEVCTQRFTGWRHHHRQTVCEPGHYENKFVSGRYEQQQDWVWVPATYRPGFEVRLSSAF